MVLLPARDKQELLRRLRENATLIRECGVNRLELFGSFVRDEMGSDSDADFLVEFEPGSKTYDNFLELSAVLERALGRPVEILTIESLSPYIGPRIQREAENVLLGT